MFDLESILTRVEKPSAVVGFISLIVGAGLWMAVDRPDFIKNQETQDYASLASVVLVLVGMGILAVCSVNATGRGIQSWRAKRANVVSNKTRFDRLLVDIGLLSKEANLLLYQMLLMPEGRLVANVLLPAFEELHDHMIIRSSAMTVRLEGKILWVDPVLFERRLEALPQIQGLFYRRYGYADSSQIDQAFREIVEVDRERQSMTYGGIRI